MNKKKELILPPRESIDPQSHPIVTRRYTLITPMIEALLAEAVQWITNGVTGALIIGEPRRGKTKGRRLLAKLLAVNFPGLPVFSMIAMCYDHTSERVFFGDLLKAFKHSMHAEGTAAQRRDRLLEGIVSAVQASGQDRVVLLVDQAHYLLEMHYHWLVDLHDVLSERGIELFVFFFGQPELSAVCEELRRAGKTQILGRFMVDRLQYFGIRSIKELRGCLKAYDEKAFYPEGSDWSFSRYYFPRAFEAGWCLARLAPMFWKAFDEVRRHGAVSAAMEVPMQHFVRMVERFFLECSDIETLDPKISQEQLNKFVASTLFASIPRDQSPDTDDDSDSDPARDEP